MHDLFQRYLEKKVTADEEAELMQMLTESSDEEQHEMVDEFYGNMQEVYKMKESDADRVYKMIVKKPSSRVYSTSFRRSGLFFRISAAAAVVLIFITATLLIFNYGKENPAEEINKIVEITKPIEKPLYKNDIRPGGNKAILTLADGTKVVLDDAREGKLQEQGNTTIIKLDSGRLAYNTRSGSPLLEKIVQYNTLTTPRGGKYCVTLPDGTIVWLNASTTLRFPVAFVGKTRKVEVKGEAYFEVAKDEAMPFIVKAGNSEIKVLGTHFNVMAYADDKLLKTTLLEGSVEIVVRKQSAGEEEVPAVKLVPGQQAQLDVNNALTVVNADMEEAIAWKNGFFIFKNEPIESVMQKLARWYDVNVVYETTDESILYSANISRAKNISEVLRKLEMTETIHFKIDGKIITVLQ